MLANCDDKSRTRVIGELYAPLPGQDIQLDDIQTGPWSEEEMAKSFRATQATFAGKVGIK